MKEWLELDEFEDFYRHRGARLVRIKYKGGEHIARYDKGIFRFPTEGDSGCFLSECVRGVKLS